MVLEGKVDEGLDMLDQCLETSTANDVARACDHILVEAKLGPEPLKALRPDIVLRAVQVFHEHIQLLMVQASLRSMQMRYADAEERDPESARQRPQLLPGVEQPRRVAGLAENQARRGAAGRQPGHRGAGAGRCDHRHAGQRLPGDEPHRRTPSANSKRPCGTAKMPARLFHLAEAYRANQQVEQAKTTFEKAVEKGLTKDSLHPLEAAAFEEMRQFARQP